MKKNNFQRSRPASALTGTPPYAAVMVYKHHLCGVAQHTVTLVAWIWTWTTQACVVLGGHKEEVSGSLKPVNKVRQRIRHINAYNYPHTYIYIYINKEHAN
jgi:hypothetical protein